MKSAARLIALVLTVSMVSLQAYNRPSPVDLDLFLQPLNMTKSGVQCFFEQLFNAKSYTEDILPHNFKNLTEFLHHGKKTEQSRDYTKATLTLFGQKVKGCTYLSAYAFNDFLAELPSLIGHHFVTTPRTAEQKKRAIKEALYQEFSHNGGMLSHNAPLFFEHAAQTILQAVDTENDQEIRPEVLQQTVTRFLETCMSKLLWDSTDKNIWAQSKLITDRLSTLAEHKIIADQDDLNDLCWSLIHRLGYFVDLTGATLPLEFYEQVRTDLQNPANSFLKLEEQEALLTTKRDHLEHSILEGVAKHQALSYGIVTS